MKDTKTLIRIISKGVFLFILCNLIIALINIPFDQFSLYNWLIPGRERFAFGEEPQKSYNLTLYDMNAMLLSHVVSGDNQEEPVYKVFIVGDSSVWGTLLRPEETLAGFINASNIKSRDGRLIRAYNLGYPSMSLTKDLVIINESLKYDPDMMIWLVTLESFPDDKQLDAPIVSNNPDLVLKIAKLTGIGVDETRFIQNNFWKKTIIGQRRNIADRIRLQLYGIMWAATGIDQVYPDDYSLAARDLSADTYFDDWPGPVLPEEEMRYDILSAGVSLANDRETPIILVNEPILVSQGENSDIRYNYYYPMWAYDQYRQQLLTISEEHSWDYFDFWNLVPQEEFTNTAIHLSKKGAEMFAEELIKLIVDHH